MRADAGGGAPAQETATAAIARNSVHAHHAVVGHWTQSRYERKPVRDEIAPFDELRTGFDCPFRTS
jgi:hypothetical protein